jgi:adenylosuccinate synthase
VVAISAASPSCGSFPIRVSGNSGPLHAEITWHQLTRDSGHPTDIVEHTSVTKAIRRVGRFDPALVRQAITSNAPTKIVLNHLDYVDSSTQGAGLTPRMFSFLAEAQSAIQAPITHIGLGPSQLQEAPDVQR